MPDNELMLKIKGDSSSAKSALGDLTKALGGSKSAFGSLVGAVSTGAVVAEAAQFLKGTIDRAKEQQAETAKLQVAIRNTGAEWGAYAGQVTVAENAAVSMGYSDDAMTAALSNLTTMTGSASTAMNDYQLVMDLARFKNMDLATAAGIVAKAEEGKIGIIARQLPFLDAQMTKEEALAALSKAVSGQAEAHAETAAGAVDVLNASYDQLQETIGFRLLPVAVKLTTTLSDLVKGFNSLDPATQDSIIDSGLLIGGMSLSVIGAAQLITALSILGKTHLSTAIATAVGNSAMAQTAVASMSATGGLVSMTAASNAAALGWLALAGAAGIGIGMLINQIPAVRDAQAALGENIANLKAVSQYQADANAEWGVSADTQAMMAKMYDATTGELTAYGRELQANSAKAAAASQSADDLRQTTAQTAAAADDAAVATKDWTRAMDGAKVAADDLRGTERSLVELDLASRTANLDLTDAQKALTDARKKHGKNSEEVQRAEIGLTQAQIKAKDAARDLADAQVTAGVKVDGTTRKVNDYRKELGLIPASKTTSIVLKTPPAIDSLVNKIKYLGGTHIIDFIATLMPPSGHDEGGYFTRPHLASIAEKGLPEYVINPLKPNAPSLISAAARDAGMGTSPVGGGGVVNLTQNISIAATIKSDMDIRELAKKLTFEASVALRAAGVIG